MHYALYNPYYEDKDIRYESAAASYHQQIYQILQSERVEPEVYETIESHQTEGVEGVLPEAHCAYGRLEVLLILTPKEQFQEIGLHETNRRDRGHSQACGVGKRIYQRAQHEAHHQTLPVGQITREHKHKPYIHQRRRDTHDMDIVEEKPLSQGEKDYVGDVSHNYLSVSKCQRVGSMAQQLQLFADLLIVYYHDVAQSREVGIEMHLYAV